MKHIHVGCGGNLTYSHTDRKTVTKHFRSQKTGKMVTKEKTIAKDMFRCDKCNELVNCILYPSYEELKEREARRNEANN